MYQEYVDKKAADLAETEFVVLGESTYVADAARIMREKDVSSVLVNSLTSKQPVGIVTERDILYKVVAEHRSPFKTVMGDVMSSPLVTVEESTLVKDAIALMRKNRIRRLPVTKGGKIVGMLTLKSIIGESNEKKIDLIDLELPLRVVQLACPYCGSKFETKNDLSLHIDRLHLGTGLLEGDMRQW